MTARLAAIGDPHRPGPVRVARQPALVAARSGRQYRKQMFRLSTPTVKSESFTNDAACRSGDRAASDERAKIDEANGISDPFPRIREYEVEQQANGGQHPYTSNNPHPKYQDTTEMITQELLASMFIRLSLFCQGRTDWCVAFQHTYPFKRIFIHADRRSAFLQHA